MEWLSDLVAERWREIRLANEVILVGAAFVLVKRSRFGRQIKHPDVQVTAADLSARKKLVARVAAVGTENFPANVRARSSAASGPKPAVLHVWHEPPLSWWFGLRVWPFVDKTAVFPVRVFGVESLEPPGEADLLVKPGDQVRLRVLSRGPQDAEPNTLLAHVQYGLNADLAADLVKNGKARADPDAAPGREASTDLTHIREMDAALEKLCKTAPYS